MVQVLKIWEAASQGTYQISSLFDKKLIRDKWIVAYENSGRRPATVKAYITSLRHFYNYVLNDEPPEIEPVKGY